MIATNPSIGRAPWYDRNPTSWAIASFLTLVAPDPGEEATMISMVEGRGLCISSVSLRIDVATHATVAKPLSVYVYLSSVGTGTLATIAQISQLFPTDQSSLSINVGMQLFVYPGDTVSMAVGSSAATGAYQGFVDICGTAFDV